MTKKLPDAELKKRLKADDKGALEQVYLEYRNEFVNFTKRYEISHEDAIDVYQDATIALYQKFVSQDFELKTSSVKTYLFGIAKNKLYQLLKANNRKVDFKLPENVEAIDIEENTPSEKITILANHLDALSDSCRQLIKMFYYRNLTIDEIVELTDYKDGNTVRSHKSRCIKRLKKSFGIIK